MKSLLLVISTIILITIMVYMHIPHSPASPQATIKAVYLVRGHGALNKDELARHPEVVVTYSFNTFKEYARQRVALWLDINVLNGALLKDDDALWFETPPQAFYPFVLVGYSGPLGESLNTCDVLYDSCPPEDTGFSVMQRREVIDDYSYYDDYTFAESYTYKPHVEDILSITNGLLDGTIKPTPISTLPPGVATPTFVTLP